MSMKRCSKCGRTYPDLYERCPYCNGRRKRRTRADEIQDTLRALLVYIMKKPERLLIALAAVIVTVALLGIILTRCTGKDAKPEDDKKEPDQTTQSAGSEPQTTPLALSQAELAVYVGETVKLTASGGTGSFEWTTSDETVAAVSGGTITAKAAGTVVVKALCGGESVACTVTVIAIAPAVEVDLNYKDFTIREKDPPVQMKVFLKGTKQLYDGTVVWSIGDASVATVSETGLVEPVGKGNTVVKATIGSKTLECIVRVS